MQEKTERNWAERSEAVDMKAKRKPLYLKVSVSSFGENSRDERELSAAEEATVKKRRFPRFHHKKTTSCHKTILEKAAVHDRMKEIL